MATNTNPNTSHDDVTVEVITREEVEEAASFIRSKFDPGYASIEVGVICGTGLGKLADNVEEPRVIIPYTEIPGFPMPTVQGHAGRLVIGKLGGKVILCMQGRIHAYEGKSVQRITFPVKVMHLLGVKTLFITNAAGGVNMDFRMGDFMLLKDHIYVPGFSISPLIGPHDDSFGPRFVQLDSVYTLGLRQLARRVASEQGIYERIKEGVYFMVHGPQFSTYAELGLIQKLGGDAIGMSTCPEVCIAGSCGMKVLAIAVITDTIAQYNTEPVTHELVLREGAKASETLTGWVAEIISRL